jgi:hypothetical protein
VIPAGTALRNHHLVLPESWGAPTRHPRDRRDKAPLPQGLRFCPKPRIAADRVRHVAVLGMVERDGVVADAASGRAGPFRAAWEGLGQRSVVEGPVPTAVGTAARAGCVPASSGRGRKPTAPAREAVRSVAERAAE